MAKENRLLHRTNKDGEKTQNKQEHGVVCVLDISEEKRE